MVYSSGFEVVLNPEDFGKSRQQHNKICNQLLLERLESFERSGEVFSDEIDTSSLIAIIKSKMKACPGPFVWEHCHSTKAQGRHGVMRLVPKDQHTPGSEFWKSIHSGYKSRGGYHEWAIPAGAPTSIPKKYRKELHGIRSSQIARITNIESLAPYFKKAVLTNNLSEFQKALEQAKKIASPDQLHHVFIQSHGKKQENLLHLAAAHGCVPIMTYLIQHVKKPLEFAEKRNWKGNTPAHIAAEHNRERAVRILKLSGVNLSITNNEGITAEEIREEQKTLTHLNDFHIKMGKLIEPDNIPNRPSSKTQTTRDPAFTYCRLSTPSQKSIPETQAKFSAPSVVKNIPVPQQTPQPIAVLPSIKQPPASTLSLTTPSYQAKPLVSTIKPTGLQQSMTATMHKTIPPTPIKVPAIALTSRPSSAPCCGFWSQASKPLSQIPQKPAPTLQRPMSALKPVLTPPQAKLIPRQNTKIQPRLLPKASAPIPQQVAQRTQQEQARQQAKRIQEERTRQIRQQAERAQQEQRTRQLAQQQALQRAQQERTRQATRQQAERAQQEQRAKQLAQQQALQRTQQERMRQAARQQAERAQQEQRAKQLAQQALQRAQQERTRQIMQQQQAMQRAQQAAAQRTYRR